MLYGAIDIHKHVFQAAVFDPVSGECEESRFAASRDDLNDWAMRWQGKLTAVAIEATTGWRWVARELQARGFDVRLADPAQAAALQAPKRRAKTDRLDARWLCILLAKELLPEAWLPPAAIQWLRDRTRLRKAIADDRTRWAQRLHALLCHEGWRCRRGRLLTREGRRWVAALNLPASVRTQVELELLLIDTLEQQKQAVETELRRFARTDGRCQALERLYGIGPILACHILAELGCAARFRRARQVARVAGLDPRVLDSGESSRRGRLAKQGSPELRWALVEAARQARRASSPDHGSFTARRARAGEPAAVLTLARTIGRRAYHTLHALELEQDQAA